MLEEVRLNRKYASFYLAQPGKQEDEYEGVIRKKVIGTNDFLTRFNQDIDLSKNEILPRNCRYVDSRGRESLIYVIEEEPAIREILIDIDLTSSFARIKRLGNLERYGLDKNTNLKRPYKARLAFPYVIHFIKIDELDYDRSRVFFRTSPLTSKRDVLFKAYLLNVSTEGGVCAGFEHIDSNNIVDTINEYIAQFWNSKFNDEITGTYKEYLDSSPELGDIFSWEYYTKTNPSFVFTAKWLKSRTMKDILYDMRSRSDNFIDLNQFYSIFTNKAPVQTDDDHYLEYNYCNEFDLGDVILEIGDGIKFENGKEVFINSFIGDIDEDEIKYIEVENQNGKVFKMKVTPQLNEFIINQFTNSVEVEEVTLQNGDKLKVNDIVIVNFPERSYRQVLDIREARDKKIEVKLNKDYYLLDKLEVEKANLDNLVLSNVKLKKGKLFYLYKKSPFDTDDFIRSYQKVIYKDFSVLDGYFTFIFESETGKFINARANEPDRYYMVDPEKTTPINGIYRLGLKLFNFNNAYQKDDHVALIGDMKLSEDEDILKTFISDDGKELNIPGFDFDINFKVGDKVIIPNWREPQKMLTPNTIDSFFIDPSVSKLKVKAIDQNNEETIIPYMSAKGFVRVGAIRKMADEFEGYRVGSRIKAKIAGISNFPKKDINKIVAFITDTGCQPLVLLSNGCTLWPRYLSHFDIDQPSCFDQELAPFDSSKIKIQPGDIFIIRGGRIMVVQNTETSLGFVHCDNLHEGRNYVHSIGSYEKPWFRNDNRFGIIGPRYIGREIPDYLVTRLPNYHNYLSSPLRNFPRTCLDLRGCEHV